MARISSSDDLYLDLSSPDPSTSGGDLKNATVPEEIWIADEEENTLPSLEEEKLKKDEMNLYAELLESDIDKRKEKTQATSDYEDLQKQVLHMKALIAEKDAKLSALTHQDANVRKNICSLYKTARAEIDHKDSLLTEANSRLDQLLCRRNMTIEQLKKQVPQTSSNTHNEKSKSNEDQSARRENPNESNAESHVLNKSHSDGNKKKVEQSSIKRKRSRSPPSDSKNSKIEKNPLLDKKQNFDSKNTRNTVNPISKDKLNNKKSLDTTSKGENTSRLIKTEKSDIDNSHNSNTGQNPPCVANNEPVSKKQNCDLNSEHNNNTASTVDREPSIVEVFAKMQELAFKDPATTNAIFFNLLPGELREAFLEFEQTQTNALNKLKQSFVSSYFTQCSASDASTPEENSGDNPESKNSSVFFFQQKPLHSKSENNDKLSASNDHSDSASKSQRTVGEGNVANTETDVKKSGKKSVTRHKPKKEDPLSLPKYRDESLTLYTQRHIRRHQN